LLAGTLLLGAGCRASAQATTGNYASSEDLKFVAIVSRHGVRSPTGKTDELNRYSAQPWPGWNVPPGYLTEHGAKLMQLFGAYDRQLLISQHLLATDGCEDAKHVSIIADSDQRTRETGKSLAEGLLPGCKVEVHAMAEGTRDPLFHPIATDMNASNQKIAQVALAGRIGDNPAGLAEVYRPQLQAMEEVLLGCKPGALCSPESASRASLFDIPSSIGPAKGDHFADLHSPLGTAATMAENLLLEYTDAMDLSQVGWGRVDPTRLRELMQIHTANEDVTHGTPYIARAESSNLLTHVLDSLEQAVDGKVVAGALSRPEDRLLIVVGHDTNLANISGALNLSWLIDGRLNDTPPGGALVFELWQKRGSTDYEVRTFYTAQTLEQMRNATPLDLANPPERVAVFVPGCSGADLSCSWKSFQQTVRNVTNDHSVQ
jgi:4-phytase/acid phosphatase